MNNKSRKNKIIIIVCCAAIAVAVVLCIVLFGSSSDTAPDSSPVEVSAVAEIEGLQAEENTQNPSVDTDVTLPSGNNTFPDDGNNGSGVSEMPGSSKSSSGTAQSGQPQQTTPGGKTVKPSSGKVLSDDAKAYEKYCEMSADDQYAYYKTFSSAEEFLNWYNRVKTAYEKENPAVVLNPGDVIDFSKLD